MIATITTFCSAALMSLAAVHYLFECYDASRSRQIARAAFARLRAERQ